MIEETKLHKACAWILFICGISILYIAVLEPIVHILLDMFNYNVHPVSNTGRMSSILGIITVIVGSHVGMKTGERYISYKRDKDCIHTDRK